MKTGDDDVDDDDDDEVRTGVLRDRLTVRLCTEELFQVQPGKNVGVGGGRKRMIIERSQLCYTFQLVLMR